MVTPLYYYVKDITDLISGWPLLLFVAAISLFCTVYYNFVQIRYFFESWRLALCPAADQEKGKGASITPLQAFVNSLGISLGNGSLAGVATSIYVGGPGAVFWMTVTGFFLMAVRFAEIYLSIYYTDNRMRLGGPVLYLRRLRGGNFLSVLYAILALAYGYMVGNAIQVNAISISLQNVFNLDAKLIAAFFLLFLGYVSSGGAQRILKLSGAIVPFKVVLFFASSGAVLVYYWQSLYSTIALICVSAFNVQAVAGGAIGYGLQVALKEGVLRSVMASEAGLGTTGIFFGSTESKTPMRDAIMGMLTVFISTLVCLLVGLCIVVSGVWGSGLSSTALTVAAFQTVFGVVGGWIVTLLAISFGLGLIVSYAFVVREIWLYFTGNRYEMLGNIIYCSFAVLGALCNMHVLWPIVDAINMAMLFVNLFGILLLSGVIRQGILAYQKRDNNFTK